MKKVITIICCVLGIITVCNILPVNGFLGDRDYSYSNYSATFTFEEVNFSGRDFDMCERKFEAFRKMNKQDTVLYRLRKKNIVAFWNYSDYLFSKKFKLPYMAWEEIEKRRGEVGGKTGFQDF